MGKLKFLGRFSIFLVLTALTQIGGLVYLFVVGLAGVFNWRSKIISSSVFIVAYFIVSVATIFIAPVFGRHAIECSLSANSTFKIANPIFCALNRQYVQGDLLELVQKASTAIEEQFPGSQTLVLDANFPFFDGFPLLPHLSHDDGRKVDLAFYYANDQGDYLPGQMASPIGYWGFSQPSANVELPCAELHQTLSLRWDMEFLQSFWQNYQIEPKRTSALLKWLATEGQQFGIEKILLEPHLKKSL